MRFERSFDAVLTVFLRVAVFGRAAAAIRISAGRATAAFAAAEFFEIGNGDLVAVLGRFLKPA
jgi:hypothetical protein